MVNDDATVVRKILEFFRTGSYNGQKREHITTVSEAFISDLVESNDTVASAAQQGKIVYERNYNATIHQFSRSFDLAIGPPVESSTTQGHQQQLTTTPSTIREDSVERVWLALNIESLIFGVGRNWKNRGEDIYAFYLTVYDRYNLAVTGSVVLLNVSDLGQSNAEQIISSFEEFDFADGSIAQALDGMAIIPLNYERAEPTKTEIADGLVPKDHPLHYHRFVQVMANGLARRIEGQFKVSSESLDSVLAESETEVLEFKQELDDLSDIAKETVALANHDGGSVLIGVDDDGTAIGLDDIETAEERVTGILKNIEPSTVNNIEKATYEGKEILIVNISRATSTPVSYNGTFYIRKGTSKNRMTGQEILQTFPRE